MGAWSMDEACKDTPGSLDLARGPASAWAPAARAGRSLKGQEKPQGQAVAEGSVVWPRPPWGCGRGPGERGALGPKTHRKQGQGGCLQARGLEAMARHWAAAPGPQGHSWSRVGPGVTLVQPARPRRLGGGLRSRSALGLEVRAAAAVAAPAHIPAILSSRRPAPPPPQPVLRQVRSSPHPSARRRMTCTGSLTSKADGHAPEGTQPASPPLLSRPQVGAWGRLPAPLKANGSSCSSGRFKLRSQATATGTLTPTAGGAGRAQGSTCARRAWPAQWPHCPLARGRVLKRPRRL